MEDRTFTISFALREQACHRRQIIHNTCWSKAYVCSFGLEPRLQCCSTSFLLKTKKQKTSVFVTYVLHATLSVYFSKFR
ncbi:hypothetical protein CROQUDRAFT_244497 [Cronartium quercuum f. sp. fusiforme G11]|uniref:Uncharacterized protein n=1 Tax=Cronartium quercuum f. sp. fusiforme G11 TaxID=708437 RepID=A0A9P6T865_9BASI|nr:hypothetical protein CROQUDRAFT_244497 [Cronartium quercuum f. sp. fusiforme G11]